MTATAGNADAERVRLWGLMGIPLGVARVLLCIDQTKALVQHSLRFFHKDDRRSTVALGGGVGAGKTIAACWGIGHAVEAGRRTEWIRGGPPPIPYEEGIVWLAGKPGTGRFVQSIDLVRAGTFQDEFWRKLEGASGLVIDDVGAEPADDKGWYLANLNALVTKRDAADRKTMFTTNLTRDELAARWNGTPAERIVDRMDFVANKSKSLRHPETAAEALVRQVEEDQR